VDEREFTVAAEAMLARIERALEACGADFDFEAKPGGILELEFADGGKIIINRHTAAREIWLAAKSGGFHFRFVADDGSWRGTRDGADLLDVLARCMSDQAGETIKLA